MPDLTSASKHLNKSTREVENLGLGDVISEDQAEEIDTYNQSVRIDELEEHDHTRSEQERDIEPLREPVAADKKRKLKDGVVQQASEGIIEPSTRQEYRRHWEAFIMFLKEENLMDDDAIATQLPNDVPAEMPEWICYWIMSRADTLDIHTGEELHPKWARITYGHAQKMRAAMTHKFGREFGKGTIPWMENPSSPGQFTGNPSISLTVSQHPLAQV